MTTAADQNGHPAEDRPADASARAWNMFLKRARRSRGVSQRALARQLGVSQARIAQIEGGASAPQVDTMAAYIAALGGELVLRARFDDDTDSTVESAPPVGEASS
jgi:transcriptional regulator with XRE-family HTH domain